MLGDGNKEEPLLAQQIQWQEKHCKWLCARLDALRELEEVSGGYKLEEVQHLTSALAQALVGFQILQQITHKQERLSELIVERWKKEFSCESWNVPSDARMKQMAEWAVEEQNTAYRNQ